ncbi:Vinexin [Quaeritorhiza haematococci]|nr:Vinexin [Quaeritorhiza haematococci]
MIIIIAVGGGLLLLLVGVGCCLCSRRKRRRNEAKKLELQEQAAAAAAMGGGLSGSGGVGAGSTRFGGSVNSGTSSSEKSRKSPRLPELDIAKSPYGSSGRNTQQQQSKAGINGQGVAARTPAGASWLDGNEKNMSPTTPSLSRYLEVKGASSPFSVEFPVLDPKSPTSPTPGVFDLGYRSSRMVYCVVHNYAPQRSDEVELLVGDIVHVRACYGDGWCEGTNQRTNVTGFFPKTYLAPRELSTANTSSPLAATTSAANKSSSPLASTSNIAPPDVTITPSPSDGKGKALQQKAVDTKKGPGGASAVGKGASKSDSDEADELMRDLDRQVQQALLATGNEPSGSSNTSSKKGEPPSPKSPSSKTGGAGKSSANAAGNVGGSYSVGTGAVATANFSSTATDEIELRIGDAVSIRLIYSDGWASGMNHRTGKSGTFPLHAVTRTPAANPPSKTSGVVSSPVSSPTSPTSAGAGGAVSPTSPASNGSVSVRRRSRRTTSLAYTVDEHQQMTKNRISSSSSNSGGNKNGGNGSPIMRKNTASSVTSYYNPALPKRSMSISQHSAASGNRVGSVAGSVGYDTIISSLGNNSIIDSYAFSTVASDLSVDSWIGGGSGSGTSGTGESIIIVNGIIPQAPANAEDAPRVEGDETEPKIMSGNEMLKSVDRLMKPNPPALQQQSAQNQQQSQTQQGSGNASSAPTSQNAAGGEAGETGTAPQALITIPVTARFVPVLEDEIEVNVGDLVTIRMLYDDGWCVGTNLRSGKSGVFPLISLNLMLEPADSNTTDSSTKPIESTTQNNTTRSPSNPSSSTGTASRPNPSTSASSPQHSTSSSPPPSHPQQLSQQQRQPYQQPTHHLRQPALPPSLSLQQSQMRLQQQQRDPQGGLPMGSSPLSPGAGVGLGAGKQKQKMNPFSRWQKKE